MLLSKAAARRGVGKKKVRGVGLTTGCIHLHATMSPIRAYIFSLKRTFHNEHAAACQSSRGLNCTTGSSRAAGSVRPAPHIKTRAIKKQLVDVEKSKRLLSEC